MDPSQVHFDDNLVEFINPVNYDVDLIVMKRWSEHISIEINEFLSGVLTHFFFKIVVFQNQTDHINVIFNKVDDLNVMWKIIGVHSVSRC